MISWHLCDIDCEQLYCVGRGRAWSKYSKTSEDLLGKTQQIWAVEGEKCLKRLSLKAVLFCN